MKTALIAILTLSTLAMAQTGASDSASATASAEIIQPLELQKTADLDFGKIISNNSAGSVTVHADGSPQSDTGGASTYEEGNRAAFSVEGEADWAYNLTMPASVTLVSGSDSMAVALSNSLTNDASVLDSLGEDEFHVGGELAVGANQASGNYVGTFEVSIAYP